MQRQGEQGVSAFAGKAAAQPVVARDRLPRRASEAQVVEAGSPESSV